MIAVVKTKRTALPKNNRTTDTQGYEMKPIMKKPLAATISTLAVLSLPSFSQSNDASLSSMLMEEVVVTAQKREQNIQDVPVAVTALDGRMLRAQGINEPKDLKNIIPNFAVGTYQGETKITIRGVGQLIQASNPGVAIHIDGVYQPRASMAGLTQIDMAGVEVLRGPQGTTYGRNANGGAVNYSTTAAGDEFGGYVLGSYSEYNERRLQAGFDLPISDAVRTRLTLDSWDRGEGIYENRGAGGDGGEGDTFLARFRVDADFSDTVSGTLILSHAAVDGSFAIFDSVTPMPETVRTRSPIPGLNDIFFTPPTDASLDPLQISQNTTSENQREFQAIAAILDWEINDTFGFKSITAVQTWEDLRITDNDLTNGDIVDNRTQEEGDTFTQEFNLTFSTD